MKGSSKPGKPLLGGLLRYNPDPKLTGVDRMRIVGAMLQDIGAGGGNALSGVHDDIYGRIEANREQSDQFLRTHQNVKKPPLFLHSMPHEFAHLRAGKTKPF